MGALCRPEPVGCVRLLIETCSAVEQTTPHCLLSGDALWVLSGPGVQASVAGAVASSAGTGELVCGR